MKSMTIMTIIAIVLVAFSIIQAFQINAIKGSASGNAVSDGSSSSGETYEQMMARMHPDQVKKQSAAPKGLENIPSMVGGC